MDWYFLQMDRQGNMFNLFMDADGTPQRLRIGNINDLVPLDSAKEVTLFPALTFRV